MLIDVIIIPLLAIIFRLGLSPCQRQSRIQWQYFAAYVSNNLFYPLFPTVVVLKRAYYTDCVVEQVLAEEPPPNKKTTMQTVNVDTRSHVVRQKAYNSGRRKVSGAAVNRRQPKGKFW